MPYFAASGMMGASASPSLDPAHDSQGQPFALSEGQPIAALLSNPIR
jgi:hypothetical protein